ncbi:MAG: hypothetical protein LBT68_05745 [Spirochaetales bacterium]|jgi:hypothetical protein|nr:hypothetical protein [Spirochaetales bacterium]
MQAHPALKITLTIRRGRGSVKLLADYLFYRILEGKLFPVLPLCIVDSGWACGYYKKMDHAACGEAEI